MFDKSIAVLDKALLSDKPSVALEYMHKMGILDELIPELSALKGCPQNPVFHPEGDVWNHTMLVVDEGAKVKDQSKQPRHFMYACLLHDIGKPNTTKEDTSGRIRSKDHDKVGAELSQTVLKRLTNETGLIRYVSTLTAYHMRAHKILEMKAYKVKKMMMDVDMHELLLLNTCDISGRDMNDATNKRLNEIDEKRQRISDFSVGAFGKINPLFSGKDLIDNGFTPGKDFGELLEYVFDLQLQGHDTQSLTTVLNNKLTKQNEQ